MGAGERVSGNGPEEELERQDRRSGLEFVDVNVAVIGGAVAAVVGFGGLYALGSVGGVEARRLLESTLPTLRFLCSTVGTAAATILALMLTLLSLSHSTQSRLKRVHYLRIKQISWMASLALIASVGVLMLLVIPLGEADRFPTDWFNIVYYILLGLSALLGGLTVALVMMLLNAVQALIAVVAPGGQPGIVADQD